MIPRLTAVLAGAIALWAGAASAAPDSQTVTLENRVRLVAARMSRGESYDQATRAVPLPQADERSQAIAQEMAKGCTYRQAWLIVSERPDVVNGRWTKHAVAMSTGGAHEAGWAASSR